MNSLSRRRMHSKDTTVKISSCSSSTLDPDSGAIPDTKKVTKSLQTICHNVFHFPPTPSTHTEGYIFPLIHLLTIKYGYIFIKGCTQEMDCFHNCRGLLDLPQPSQLCFSTQSSHLFIIPWFSFLYCSKGLASIFIFLRLDLLNISLKTLVT